MRLPARQDYVYLEREGCSTKRKSEFVHEGTFRLHVPISVFRSVTRSPVHDPNKITPVELVRVEEASRADPALATILSGNIKYVGQEDLFLAGRKWRADKFELKVPLHAPFLIWTSPEGLLLGFGLENGNKTLSETGMQLVSFRQWEEF